jgi:hypothetical protein
LRHINRADLRDAYRGLTLTAKARSIRDFPATFFTSQNCEPPERVL